MTCRNVVAAVILVTALLSRNAPAAVAASKPISSPYVLSVTPAGIRLAWTAKGTPSPVLQSLDYEADTPHGLAFRTSGIRQIVNDGAVTRAVFGVEGPASAQAAVTVAIFHQPRSVRLRWSIRYHGDGAALDPYHCGFMLGVAQPVLNAEEAVAIRFVRPTGALPYEVKGDTPYRDLDWQLRQVTLPKSRLIVATRWYDPDWIYGRQVARATRMKADLPASGPADADYEFSLVPVSPTSPSITTRDGTGADVAAMASGRSCSFAVLCDHPADLFAPGEPVRFRIRIRNVADAPLAIPLRWRVWDYDGRDMATGTESVRLAAGSVRILPVAIARARRGMLFLDATLGSGDNTWVDRTTFAVLPKRPFDGPRPSSPFGLAGLICDPQTYPDQRTPQEVLAVAQRVGARWARIGVPLDTAEDPREDTAARDWQALLTRFGMSRHVQVHMALPTPEDAADFRAKARAILIRFRNLTPEIEFGNELNLAGASPQDYIDRLLRPVHDLGREVDPHGQIMSMGLGGVDKTWLDGFVAAGGIGLIDVLSVHPGSQPRAPEYWQGYRGWVFRPEALDALQAAGGKPVWFSEAYAPTSPERSELDVRTSADYLVRTYVVSLALGVRVVEWYQLQDGTWFAQRPNPADEEYNYGLIYTDLTPKPAYVAYATLTSELEGEAYVGRLDLGADDLYGVRFRRGVGIVDVLWSYRETHETDLAWWPPARFRDSSRRPGEPWVNRWHHPVMVKLRAAGPVTVMDIMGNRRTMLPHGAFVTLALSGSPLYVSGLSAMPVHKSLW